jgi:hypothetical protein
VRTGDNDKVPYGSMQKVLEHYSTYQLSQSQVQKRAEIIKMQEQFPHQSLFIPSANHPFPPPVDKICIPGQIGSPKSLLTGPTVGLLSSTDGAHSSDRAKGGQPNGTTHEAK